MEYFVTNSCMDWSPILGAVVAKVDEKSCGI